MKQYLSVLVMVTLLVACGTNSPKDEQPPPPSQDSVTGTVQAQESVVPENNRTLFASYADAATFLRGLTAAETDDYGNIVMNRDGTWGNRCEFRLGDVVLSKEEITTVGEYYGGEVGPRVNITVKCKQGPCVKDPLNHDSPLQPEHSFFIVDIPKGRQVFETLQTMQAMLAK